MPFKLELQVCLNWGIRTPRSGFIYLSLIFLLLWPCLLILLWSTLEFRYRYLIEIEKNSERT